MQSEEERGGGSDHAYDKTGEEKKNKNQERMRGGVETREVSEGNSVTGKCRNTVCSVQLVAYTHTCTNRCTYAHM